MSMQSSKELGRIMMGVTLVPTYVSGVVARGTPIKHRNDDGVMRVLGLAEEDVDKALKDYAGNPIRAPRDLEPGELFIIPLSNKDGKPWLL